MRNFVPLRDRLNSKLAKCIERSVRTPKTGNDVATWRSRKQIAVWRNRKQADVLTKAYYREHYPAAGSK